MAIGCHSSASYGLVRKREREREREGRRGWWEDTKKWWYMTKEYKLSRWESHYFKWVGLGIGKGVNDPSWKVVFCLQLPKILILLKTNQK